MGWGQRSASRPGVEELVGDGFGGGQVVPVGGLFQDVAEEGFPGGGGKARREAHDARFRGGRHGEPVGDAPVRFAPQFHENIREGEHRFQDAGFAGLAVRLEAAAGGDHDHPGLGHEVHEDLAHRVFRFSPHQHGLLCPPSGPARW